jgi:hypothetical protein
MTELSRTPWFRLHAANFLLDDRLAELDDHEFRIWFGLLCTASLEAPRWEGLITRGLARKCYTAYDRLRAALDLFRRLGLIELEVGLLDDYDPDRPGERPLGRYRIAHPEKYGTPTDSRDAAAVRKRRQRESQREKSPPGHSDNHELSRYRERGRGEERREEKEKKKRERETEGEGVPPHERARLAWFDFHHREALGDYMRRNEAGYEDAEAAVGTFAAWSDAHADDYTAALEATREPLELVVQDEATA